MNDNRHLITNSLIAAVISGVMATGVVRIYIGGLVSDPMARPDAYTATMAAQRRELVDTELLRLWGKVEQISDSREKVIEAQQRIINEFQALSQKSQDKFHQIMRKLEQLERRK